MVSLFKKIYDVVHLVFNIHILPYIIIHTQCVRHDFLYYEYFTSLVNLNTSPYAYIYFYIVIKKNISFVENIFCFCTSIIGGFNIFFFFYILYAFYFKIYSYIYIHLLLKSHHTSTTR